VEVVAYSTKNTVPFAMAFLLNVKMLETNRTDGKIFQLDIGQGKGLCPPVPNTGIKKLIYYIIVFSLFHCYNFSKRLIAGIRWTGKSSLLI